MLGRHLAEEFFRQQLLYSIAGFCIGVIVGFFMRCYKSGRGRRKDRRVRAGKNEGRRQGDAYDPAAPIPDVIPQILFNEQGEPIIAREQVRKESPVPRSIAIIIIIMAAMSVAYNAVQQVQRNNDNERANRALQRQVTANKELLDKQVHQQAVINGNEQRLEDLVLSISTAKTPGQVTEAIQRFLKSSARAHAAEQKYQQQQGGQPGDQPSSDTRGSASPSPRSSASPRSSHSASPTPSPSHSPKPSPSPTKVVLCVPTPRAPVCATVPPLPPLASTLLVANRTTASTGRSNMLDVHVAMLLIAAFISPVVGLLTRWHAPSWFKSVLNLGLTTLGVVIPTVVWTDGVSWKVYVINIAQAWAVSIAAHYGFYRPTSTAKKGWFQTPSTASGNTGLTAPVLPHQKRHAAHAPRTHVAA